MQTEENLMSHGEKFDLEEVKETYLNQYDKQLNIGNASKIPLPIMKMLEDTEDDFSFITHRRNSRDGPKNIECSVMDAQSQLPREGVENDQP